MWIATVVPIAALGDGTLYAGHAGSGSGDPNPGAFSLVDTDTGQVTIIGTANASGGVAGLASNGSVIYAALAVSGAAVLATIDPATGNVDQTIGPITLSGGGPCAIGDLAMGASGVLYGFTSNGNGHVCDGHNAGTLVTINTTTAVATALARPMEVLYGATNVNGGLAVDGSGQLWLSPGWNHPDLGKFFRLNTTTGLVEATLILSGEFPNIGGANGLGWNPTDGLLYASFESTGASTNLWAVNPTTGTSQLVADNGYNLHDLVSTNATLPSRSAPVLHFGTLGILAGLLAALGCRMRAQKVG